LTLSRAAASSTLEGSNIQANHLRGLAAAGYPAGIVTDSAVASVIPAQHSDGHWPQSNGFVRSPTTEGAISWTAEALLALKAYTIPARRAEFEERISRGAEWLFKAKPHSTDQKALTLLAISAAGAAQERVRWIGASLLREQRADGGWGGNANLTTDAHSTGKALHALREAGLITTAHPAHRRGVQYLLKTQYPDGAWYVRSRAVGFQPYVRSGFPFDHDQWISAAGTAWAAEAIASSLQREEPTAQPPF
jgi:hypothetical protein